MSRVALIAFTFLALSAAGCTRYIGPDYGPIGTGMKFVGVCAVLCALVTGLVSLITGEETRRHGREQRQQPPRSDREGGDRP